MRHPQSKAPILAVFFIIAAVCLIPVISPATAPASENTFHTSRVKDISDRGYEKAVIELLDNARESIVVSMYNVNLDTKRNNPVKLMLNDLIEARQRGVEVVLYLNTLFPEPEKDRAFFMQHPIIKKLESAGCTIHLMPSSKRLHDKLVIVDKRYVVEGSTNWSISGFRVNFESASLIDSPGLAQVKLKRLEYILKLASLKHDKPYTPAYTENLPQNLSIPDWLLLDKKYLPKMVSANDERAFNLYILLLAHSQLTGKGEFFLSLEDMAISLDLPHSWTSTAKRRQVIKSLKKLKSRYHLIDVEFFHGKNAYVTLCHPERSEGSSFLVGLSPLLVDAGFPLRCKFYFLVKDYLKEQGEDIGSIPSRVLAHRFNVSASTILSARKDLESISSL